MGLRALFFSVVLSFLSAENFSQDYFSYGGGNYSGLQQVIANPAAAADNRLKADVIMAGADAGFNNSWFEIRRQALNYNRGAGPKFPVSWKNTTPNVPDNVFKNFNAIGHGENRAAVIESRVLLPSFMVQVDSKNSVAFTWSVRQIANVDGISAQLATLFEKELDLNVTQNNRVQNKSLTAVQMAWAEYGLTYARVLKDKNRHFIKAGITPKILQGLESGYLVIRDLDFLLSTKDTSSYFNADFSYARSANFHSPAPVGKFYHRVTKARLGLDLGIIYEWRPKYEKFKYRPDGKRYAWRKDLNKYRLKFGAALVDLGKIRFDKQGTYYDLDVSVRRNNFTKFTEVKNYAMFDSLLRADFSSEYQASDFSVLLPTALNTQVDYAVNRFFYFNLSAHLTGFNKRTIYKVHNYTAVCFAPRIEHYWFEVSVPLSWNALSAKRSQYVMPGLALRLGPLSLGTSNMVPLVRGDVSNLHVYALLRAAIPYRLIRDQDGDGVRDQADACPDEPGDTALGGCPDKDQDKIPDKEDACPHQRGIVAHRGCPDTDMDGIVDGKDECPLLKGSLLLKGCPDTDGDSIPDKDDACPGTRGLKKFMGCPDTDEDGITDLEDLCPAARGPAKYKGCPDTDHDLVHDGADRCPGEAGSAGNNGCPWPDTDKDGIDDQLDSCINSPGTVEFKGCPPPLKLMPAEKRVLQKAHSSLEFASGKDLIKPASFPSLNALAKLLVKHKNEWTIILSGHTDNEGTETSNLILSEKRVAAVKSYLAKKGVPAENIKLEWFGQSRNIADNASEEGKQRNRRVDMTVTASE